MKIEFDLEKCITLTCPKCMEILLVSKVPVNVAVRCPKCDVSTYVIGDRHHE